MSETAEQFAESNLAQKMWSRYVRNERQYDAWGAQGKILLLQEVVTESEYSQEVVVTIRAEWRRIINYVFPRTFFATNEAPVSKSLIKEVQEYHSFVLSLLADHGVEPDSRAKYSLEETAGKFDIPVGRVKEILAMTSVERGEKDSEG